MAAKKSKRSIFVFKDQYAKAYKIAVKNDTLGRYLRLTKEQIKSMAERGTLSSKQIESMFKPQEQVNKEA